MRVLMISKARRGNLTAAINSREDRQAATTFRPLHLRRPDATNTGEAMTAASGCWGNSLYQLIAWCDAYDQR
jgi:hypothetical protein